MENGSGIVGFFTKPFALGLYVGLAFALFVFIREKIVQLRIRRGSESLKRHLQAKLDVESEEIMRRKKDFDALRAENENLRITLQSYIQKPGRRELRQLHAYQRAVDILTEKAPGFAQSWQSALREGEEEIRRTDLGVVPFLTRLIPRVSRRSLKSGHSKDE